MDFPGFSTSQSARGRCVAVACASAEPLQAAISPIRSLVAPAIVTQTGARRQAKAAVGSLGKSWEKRGIAMGTLGTLQ